MANAILDVTDSIQLQTSKTINGAWTAKMQIEVNSHIQAEGYVEFNEELYIVKKLKRIKRKGKKYFDVRMYHNMSELSDVTIERFYIKDTISNHLTYLLADTNWTAGTCNITGTIILKIDKRTSVLDVLNTLAEKADGELNFNSKVRTVDLKDAIGTVTKNQIRYDKNADYIEKTEDTTSLITRLYAYGADNLPINTLQLQSMDDATDWTASGTSTATDVTVTKMEGSGCVSFTNSDGETLTIDLGAGSTLDLSDYDVVDIWVFDNTGSGLDFDTNPAYLGIGEGAWDNNKVALTGTVNADSWKKMSIDISGVADADKNAIRYVGFEGGGEDVYLDDIRAIGTTYLDNNTAEYTVKKEGLYFHSTDTEVIQKTVKLYPTADAYVTTANADTNYGTATVLKALNGGNVGQPADSRKSVMKWDLSEIPSNATITSATMNLYMNKVGSSTSQSVMGYVTTTWTETGVTHNTYPTIDASSIYVWDTNGVAAGWVDDGGAIKTTVEGWLSGTITNYGVGFARSTSDCDEMEWDARDGTNKPYLLIIYTIDTSESSTVVAAATEYLYAHDEPKLLYKVKMGDLSKAIDTTWEDETLALGDTLRVYDSDLGINVDVRIKKITKDLLNPINTQIELANRTYDITDTQAELEKKLSAAMPFNNNINIIDANAIQKGSLGGDVN